MLGFPQILRKNLQKNLRQTLRKPLPYENEETLHVDEDGDPNAEDGPTLGASVEEPVGTLPKAA
jgi:hypothetical protein